MRRYAGMVFNVCYRVTKDKHEAEDATQAVFLTLALQARRGTDIKALGPWLQQVAKRLSLDSRRSKKRRKTREERHQVEQTDRMESILGDTLPSADMDELKTILHEELQKLPAKYRLPLILHYFGGLSRDEMAAELNCKPSTLGVRIFRGREMLAGRLSGRGITISASMLAAGLTYAVKRGISDNLILSTSHAATAMMAGYDGSGYASASVIGLTRRATSVLAFGKVRITAITLMMAGTSLGAGAKAMGILPTINVQQLITDQMNRLIRPLLNPLSRSLRVDAQQALPAKPSASSTTSLAQASGDSSATFLPLPVSKQVTPITAPVIATAATGNNSSAVDPVSSLFSSGFMQRYTLITRRQDDPTSPSANVGDKSTAVASASQLVDAADSSSNAGSGDSSSVNAFAALSSRSADALPTRTPPSAYSGIPNITISSNDLIIGYATYSASASSTKVSGASQQSISTSPLAVIQIPASNGVVTETSAGILSGYGTIDRTGVLINDGQVVANGFGVDRTLNLTQFKYVKTGSNVPTASASDAVATVTMASNISAVSQFAATTNTTSVTRAVVALPTTPATTPSSIAAVSPIPTSSPSANSTTPSSFNTQGWYATNHGRLLMGLQSGSDPSVLTWGENPGDGKLGLVNSVRLSLGTKTGLGSSPTDLALLASDRDDGPCLSDVDGVPIGLWQVDSADGSLASADITVCYDASLADALGASSSSIDLWTWGGPGTSWEPVDPSSLLLDTSDQLISGYGSDFDYFAVTAIPAAGTDVRQLLADHLSQVAGLPAPSIGATHGSIVPEPTAMLPLLAAGAALLGRRRARRNFDASVASFT